jgi:hypothetical protein
MYAAQRENPNRRRTKNIDPAEAGNANHSQKFKLAIGPARKVRGRETIPRR